MRSGRGIQRLTAGQNTGLGFVESNAGRVLLSQAETPIRPLWNSPFGAGIAEDYVSGRGIRKRLETLTGQRLEIKKIADPVPRK